MIVTKKFPDENVQDSAALTDVLVLLRMLKGLKNQNGKVFWFSLWYPGNVVEKMINALADDHSKIHLPFPL